MIIQPYTFKGIDLKTALKITGTTVTDGSSENLYNVTIQINRYTDDTCQFDIEQFIKTFEDVDGREIRADRFIANYEELLISSGVLEWAIIV